MQMKTLSFVMMSDELLQISMQPAIVELVCVRNIFSSALLTLSRVLSIGPCVERPSLGRS